MTTHTPITWTDGTFIDQTYLNEQIRDNFTELLKGESIGDMTCNLNSNELTTIEAGNEHDTLTMGSSGLPEWQPKSVQGCSVWRDSYQSIPNATYTTITFSGSTFDTSNYMSTSGSSFAVPYEGAYQITVQIEWAANNTGLRELTLSGAGAKLDQRRAVDGSTTALASSIVEYLLPSTMLYFQVWQNSGGALNLTSAKAQIIALGEVL